MRRKNNQFGIIELIINLCTSVTVVALVLSFLHHLYQDKGFLADFFFTFLFSIGSIGIWIALSVGIQKGFKYLKEDA